MGPHVFAKARLRLFFRLIDDCISVDNEGRQWRPQVHLKSTVTFIDLCDKNDAYWTKTIYSASSPLTLHIAHFMLKWEVNVISDMHLITIKTQKKKKNNSHINMKLFWSNILLLVQLFIFFISLNLAHCKRLRVSKAQICAYQTKQMYCQVQLSTSYCILKHVPEICIMPYYLGYLSEQLEQFWLKRCSYF